MLCLGGVESVCEEVPSGALFLRLLVCLSAQPSVPFGHLTGSFPLAFPSSPRVIVGLFLSLEPGTIQNPSKGLAICHGALDRLNVGRGAGEPRREKCATSGCPTASDPVLAPPSTTVSTVLCVWSTVAAGPGPFSTCPVFNRPIASTGRFCDRRPGTDVSTRLSGGGLGVPRQGIPVSLGAGGGEP